MYDLLAFSVSYCIAIDELTDHTSFKLKGLSDEEWALVEELINVLKVSLTLFRIAKRRTHANAHQLFKQATLFFSRSGTPSLAKVIPPMDKLHWSLKNEIDNLKTHPAIKVALCLVQKKLNKYYSRTDMSETYRIAMGESHLLTSSISLT
jgi:hypothetical protein